MYDNFAVSFQGESFHYTVTEYSPNAVKVLLKKYLEDSAVSVVQADAQALPFEDNAFDMVLAFDVLHHVENPLKMAQELMRVSRKHIFMCEACGLSLVRKTVEKTRASREKGERSYTPCSIRSFFQGCSSVEIVPFYFFVPPKIKKKFMRPFITVSEIGQRIPGLRWQSQSMSVYVSLK
ncbi:MAG: methyltransferase domain-containing protein [Eubacterium sp.]|nr:methyltransferase domain-containing protein [Eubacterium sp.]